MSPSGRLSKIDFSFLAAGLLLLVVCAGCLALPQWLPGIGRGNIVSRIVYWGVIAVTGGFGVFQIIQGLVPQLRQVKLPSFQQNNVRFPREGLAYLLIMVVLFVGSLLTRENRLMLVFSLMAGPFVVSGGVAFAMLQATQVRRKAPVRAMAGEVFPVEIEYRNTRPILSTWMMLVEDRLLLNGVAATASVVFARVPPRTTQFGHYDMRLFRRGCYRFDQLTVSSRFPLGLIERLKHFRAPGEIRIYPRLGRLHPSWKRRMSHAMELVSLPRTRPGLFDDEFHRLREYRPGDNPRAIHWRSSARRNELILREYHQNREQNLILVLDLWQPATPAPEDDERIEWALSLVATLALEHRHDCREAMIQLFCGGASRQHWNGRAASADLESLFDLLACVQAGSAHSAQSLAIDALTASGPADRVIAMTTRSPEVSGGFETGDSRLQMIYVEPSLLKSWLIMDDESTADDSTHDLLPQTRVRQASVVAAGRAAGGDGGLS